MNYKQVMGKGSRISDSGIDKWHDFTDNDRQLCESNTQGIYYVIARDKFMSGWGGAEGRTSYFVEVCWSSTQANYAEEAISQAREMRNVRVVSKLPTRLNGHVSVYNFDYSARFNKEYFWNISKGYEKDNDIVPHDSDKTQKTNVSDSSRRVKDDLADELNNYRSPEDKKHDEAWDKLESFAQTFEPTILNEDWKDEENCVVTLGDKNSSVQLIVNCYGTYDEGLKDFAIVNDYEGYGMPDDNFFMANAIRNKATHDDELGDKLFYDIYYYLSENLTFGSNEDEISDSRKRMKDSEGGNFKYIAEVEVDLSVEDENGVYSSEHFYSKSKNKDYTWEEMIDDDETRKYSALCDTEEEAWNCAMNLLWEFVHDGYTEDGYRFNVSKVEVDENGDIVDWVEYGDTYNAWYNEHTNQINYA